MKQQTLKINFRQKQIIIGKLLGDGHLETANGKTYRLKIEHSWRQKEYVDWLYRELTGLVLRPPQPKNQLVNNREYKKYWFNTPYSGSLRFYAGQFYRQGKKVVPRLIKRWLTPLTLAVWFMDDGSIKSKECQGKIINTQAFDQQGLKRLLEALREKYQIDANLRKQKEGKQIYIPAKEVEKLKKAIGHYVLPSMKYKLG